MVGRAIFARRFGADPWQKAARSVPGDDVGIDPFGQDTEMVAMMQDTDLHAVPFFAVLGRRFTTDAVIDAGRGHQITFVGRVDKDLSPIRFAVGHLDRFDLRSRFDDAPLAIEPAVPVNGDLVFRDILLEDLFRDMGFEDPLRPLALVDRRGPLTAIAVGLASLLPPRGVIGVMFPNAVIKIPRQPADDTLVAGIGEAQPAAAEASEVFFGADDRDPFPEPAISAAAITAAEVPP